MKFYNDKTLLQFNHIKKPGFLFIAFLFCAGNGFAQKGKDNAEVVFSANTVVNEYTSLTADAVSGATSLTVSNSGLNTNNRFPGPLAKGDLVMIIQMQGASINGTATDSTWGAVTNYNNCGLYEFLEVTGTPNATTININCSLKNSYTAAGRVQVVRVPRYTTLTINSGGVLTADAWNGAQGGIVATEVRDNTVINSGGTIDITGKGFRGGKLNNETGGPGISSSFFSTDINLGGEKGESIAGYESDYTAYGGMYQKGAPANGGGGGNAWNCGGGGGGNAGDITKWTSNGNPDISTANYITAWTLESVNFPNSTSSGGGRGGYNVGFTGPDPLVTGPDNAAWSYLYQRSNDGGKGARPLDYSTGRIFFGGGGGAALEDNYTGGGGSAGGGIIYLLDYGTISGSGTITANGDSGQDAHCLSNGDAAGGAGAGGVVILNAAGNISGVSINANGGVGGYQFITLAVGESEGPGGGGGGGYIAISNGTPVTQANGGMNGLTNAPIMVKFPPDGATGGGDGIANATIGPVAFASLVVSIDSPTICAGQLARLNLTGGDTTDTYSWTPSVGLDSTGIASPLANPASTTTYFVTVSNGTCTGKDSTVVTVLPKVVITPASTDSICPEKSTTLNAGGSSSYTFTWNPSAGLSCTNCIGPVASPTATTTYTVIATNQYCSDTGVHVVKVSPLPVLSINDTTICIGEPTQLYATTNGTLSWSPGIYLSCTACNNPVITPLSDTSYIITATLGSCTVTDVFKVTTDQPRVSAGTDTAIYNGSTATLHGSGLQDLLWSPAASLSSPNIFNPVASPTVTTTYTLVGSDSYGCSATSSVVVLVNNPCNQIPVLPNAFSPNGDGKNDIYKVLNPFIGKLVSFRIYNRWGQLVFETSDINTGWDGTFNGKPEQVGAYVYYLEVICQGANLSYKGNVTLLR